MAVLRREAEQRRPSLPVNLVAVPVSTAKSVAVYASSRALRILEDKGLLTRIPGLGYYVNHS